MSLDFETFPKIPRLFRDCVISEKIDGTNAQILITETGIQAGSRNKWIDVHNDNFGFARWVADHEEELRTGLGLGRHYGEWWGPGIQRGYGQKEKRFSLFNAERWDIPERPACCGVVPVLYKGPYSDAQVRLSLLNLEAHGSVVSPGFMRPEGIVVWHTASRQMYKVTLDGDGHKG